MEVARDDIISDVAVEKVSLEVGNQFSNSRSNCLRVIRFAHFDAETTNNMVQTSMTTWALLTRTKEILKMSLTNSFPIQSSFQAAKCKQSN